LSGLLRGLIGKEAETRPGSQDPRLRGRTYAISFERVWTASLALASGGLRRWQLLKADDEQGVILARWQSWPWRRVADVRIDIGLDRNAQTRVDLRSRSRGERGDLGANARAIGRFLRRLDQAVEAHPAQILDARGTPTWSS
jgi:hypothetical protein